MKKAGVCGWVCVACEQPATLPWSSSVSCVQYGRSWTDWVSHRRKDLLGRRKAGTRRIKWFVVCRVFPENWNTCVKFFFLIPFLKRFVLNYFFNTYLLDSVLCVPLCLGCRNFHIFKNVCILLTWMRNFIVTFFFTCWSGNVLWVAYCNKFQMKFYFK